MMMLSNLARLPAKSLGRFGPRYKLVSNPNFVKIHSHQFSQHPQKPSVQSHPLKCPILGIDPNKKMPLNLFDIFLESCNGLVCMGRPSLTKQMVLWNPATNLWKNLPHSDADFGAAEIASLGLGCSAEGDDFKVVRMLSGNGKDTGDRAEVYSSKLDTWRKIEVGFGFRSLYPRNAAVVNGNPYWMVQLGDGGVALLKFDATLMAFTKLVPLPRIQDLGKDPESTFVNWKGSLAVIVSDKKYGDWLEWVDVWVYDDAEERWRMEARLGPINLEVHMLIDCSKSGKIIGGCTNQRLFLYDPGKENGCVAVSELKRPSGCSVLILPYDESLAFVEGMVPAVANNKVNYYEFEEIDGFFVSTFHHTTGEIGCYYALMGSSCGKDCSSLRVEVDDDDDLGFCG